MTLMTAQEETTVAKYKKTQKQECEHGLRKDCTEKDIIQGHVNRRSLGRRRRWIEGITEWTGLSSVTLYELLNTDNDSIMFCLLPTFLAELE